MITRNKHGKVIYMDYTLNKDNNGNQEILFNSKAALKFITMTLYPRHTLLPMIPDLFVDLDRYRHTIDSDANMRMIEGTVTEHLNSYLSAVSPSVDVNYDRIKQQMTMDIHIMSDTILKLRSVESVKKVQYIINEKKFSE